MGLPVSVRFLHAKNRWDGGPCPRYSSKTMRTTSPRPNVTSRVPCWCMAEAACSQLLAAPCPQSGRGLSLGAPRSQGLLQPPRSAGKHELLCSWATDAPGHDRWKGSPRGYSSPQDRL